MKTLTQFGWNSKRGFTVQQYAIIKTDKKWIKYTSGRLPVDALNNTNLASHGTRNRSVFYYYTTEITSPVIPPEIAKVARDALKERYMSSLQDTLLSLEKDCSTLRFEVESLENEMKTERAIFLHIGNK